MSERTYQDLGEDPSLLLVDDDDPFLKRLAKAMEKRGFEVETAGSVAAGRAIATARSPAYAVVDLRLEDGNGLDVVEDVIGALLLGTWVIGRRRARLGSDAGSAL